MPRIRLEFRYQNPAINALKEMARMEEFKMPKPGITYMRAILAGRELVKFTTRCEEPNCWFAGGSFPTEAEAEAYLDDHRTGRVPLTVPPCPAPPRRESLPSGLLYIDKLWNEMDDVVEALFTGQPYRDMSVESLKGYAKALAFSIVMLDTPVFPDIESVSRHARDRRKMRLGEIPYVATPSIHHPMATVQTVQGLHDVGPVAPKQPAPKVIPEQVIKAVRGGHAAGMFSEEDLASMYKLTVDEVRSIIS